MTAKQAESNSKTGIYRQGDVLLQRVWAIPADTKELKRDEANRIVLAHGEKTGHAHVFRDPTICALSRHDSEEIEFLLIEGGGTLRHELISGARAEHAPIDIPGGKYRLAQQVEYTPAELVRVSD